MDEADKKLLDKFNSAIAAGLGEENAKELLASLTRDEYDRLIALIESAELESIPETAKTQLLKILTTIRDNAGESSYAKASEDEEEGRS